MILFWFVKDQLIVFLKQKFRKVFNIRVIADKSQQILEHPLFQNLFIFASCPSDLSGSQLEVLSIILTSTALCYFVTIKPGRNFI